MGRWPESRTDLDLHRQASWYTNRATEIRHTTKILTMKFYFAIAEYSTFTRMAFGSPLFFEVGT
ncbi:hypothetical protein Pla100_12890 [Neorhodopirellula pilleata]|uniref:Uncharacterized protein n=1 Tax=Neorhodopirellula pilleata TaxID=2714738 RepID=A0A5C6ATS9_9BACT|nr:hypothetical protein Pla100_12890 [Neorhodopirellula pilleata]